MPNFGSNDFCFDIFLQSFVSHLCSINFLFFLTSSLHVSINNYLIFYFSTVRTPYYHTYCYVDFHLIIAFLFSLRIIYVLFAFEP